MKIASIEGPLFALQYVTTRKKQIRMIKGGVMAETALD
jgi:hypothetical protein